MNKVIKADCLDWMAKQKDDSFDFVFGSPPYAMKGDRYDCKQVRKWRPDEWVQWMMEVTEQAVRISKGYVIWIVNGPVRGRRYFPVVEMLMTDWHRQGGWCERPSIWTKNAPPNRQDWFRNDWEFAVAFKKPKSQPYFDWEAVAKPPKYSAGGHFRQRDSKGRRRRGGDYPQGKLARPSDVFRVVVGGGHMGSDLAHDNEAPFPERVAYRFVATCCPVKGKVLDPFVGSGTTLAVCKANGRNAVGLEIRDSQVDLSNRRLSE